MLRKCLANNFGFFNYLKDRYNKEKVFHLLDKFDVQDDTKRLEFQKKLILLRNEIDGPNRLGIQSIKSYLDYLFIQEKQLLTHKAIQSNDHIFYKNISDKCADVNIIDQATIISKIFYYLNGGDIKLLSLQLKFDLLLRKIRHSNPQDKFEQIFLKLSLQQVLDKLVQYTNKHYSNSDRVLIQTLSKKYRYHLNNSQEQFNERKYQEALDELVMSQTQLNEIWQKVQNKDDFRIHYQRLIIEKLVITAKAKYFLKHQDALQLFKDAINNYVDNIGINEEYIEFYTDIVKFLHNFDQQGCLQVLERLPQIFERLPQFEFNLKRLELEQLKVITLIKLEQLKLSELDKLIDLYFKLKIQNDATEYEYNIFFYEALHYLEQYEIASKYLEVALKKLLYQSQQQQSDDLIKISKSFSFKQLIQLPNAQQLFELLMQISEKSCYRLKFNFYQLNISDQIKIINTERIIILVQSGIETLQIMKNQYQDVIYQKTYNRLKYLDDLYQANKQLRTPILEILNQLLLEVKEVCEKIESLRQRILDDE